MEKLTNIYDFENSKFVAQMDCFSDGKNNMYLREEITDTCYHIFEDVEVKIPVNYDGMLKRLYGNYMELPPVDKRITHHGFEAWWK